MGAHPIMQSESRSRNPFLILCDLFSRASLEGTKCRKRYSWIDTDTATLPEIRLEVEILVCFAQVFVFPWRRDSCCD